jgi:hypothetical protein
MINNAYVDILSFKTLVELKAFENTAEMRLVFCLETETFYRYDKSNAGSADDKYFVITVNGGNTRWVAVAGKYVTDPASIAYGVTGTFEDANTKTVAVTKGLITDFGSSSSSSSNSS